MAWITSHQQLVSHPKTLRLMSMMGWDLDTTLGKLHRFWWWCVDYAEDGDLRRHNDDILAAAVGLNPDQGHKFVEAMVNCGGEVVSGFIDRKPYFRVHDWWDYAGMLLQIRHKHNPKRWQKVRSFYVGKHNNGCLNGSKNSIPTNQPDKPNQPNQSNQTNQKRFIPPTLEEIKTYCQERGNSIDPQSFFDKGESNGWVDKNGNKYKDWKAVIRTWEKYSNFKPDAGKSKEERLKEALAKARKDSEAINAIISAK